MPIRQRTTHAAQRPLPLTNLASDLLLAAAVVCVVGVLVIGASPAAMDLLLGVNLSLSFTILLASIYVADASKLPAFPTLLLLTTLFRLSLNVSSTRLILLDGDAGALITAFGEFVVGGDYVVGGVVFLVLTIVQFVVIAKGSERVAEVSARFTLDALQGKQMSIDADLRSQLITQDQARARRAALERESKLYGAMDGAMKFVKGDAIAGIVISLVNIIGGLIVGVTRDELSAGESAQLYSLLTIGDGLVSQIPALLISVAAGIVVTRVAATDRPEDSGLAREMTSQVFGNPLVVGVSAVITCGLAFVPGFPTFTLLALAALLAVASLRARWVKQRAGAEERSSRAAEARDAKPVASRPAQSFAPRALTLEIDTQLRPLLAPNDALAARGLRIQVADVFKNLSNELGVRLPELSVVEPTSPLPERGYALLAHGQPIARGVLEPARCLVFESAAVLREQGFDVVEALAPDQRSPAAWASLADQARLRASGLRVWDAQTALLRHVESALRQFAHMFIGVQETYELLESLKDKRPQLVQSLVPQVVSYALVAEVLRGLLQEQTPIRDLRQILETLARCAPEEKSPARLVELARVDLRRAICGALAQEHRTIGVYRIDPQIERRLLEFASRSAACSPAERHALVDAFTQSIDPRRHLASRPVVCVRFGELRSYLRAFLGDTLPELVVLSEAETPPDFTLDELGLVALEPAALSV